MSQTVLTPYAVAILCEPTSPTRSLLLFERNKANAAPGTSLMLPTWSCCVLQAVDSLLGGQLPLQVASSLSSSNPRLSSVLQQLGTFTGGPPSAGGSAPAPAPAPSGGEAAPFAGGGTIATLLQKAVTSGKIGEVQGSVAGAVSGAVASSVVSSAVQGASNTANGGCVCLGVDGCSGN